VIFFNSERLCAAYGTLTELKTYATSQMKAEFFESSNVIETHGLVLTRSNIHLLRDL
jgi:hypothetical protein